jgi:hypothetical protein
LRRLPGGALAPRGTGRLGVGELVRLPDGRRSRVALGASPVSGTSHVVNVDGEVLAVHLEPQEESMGPVAEAVEHVLEAALSSKGRKQLDDSAFALPGRRYPIHDEAHARNALARVAQHGSDDEKAKVRAAVKRRHPKLVQEAADSMVKASTPEPFSRSKTSNWVARGGGLPAYIQHVAHDLVEKRGKTESEAIGMAVGIIKRWARGGGNVDANTRAAAAKALAEWEALKAKAHALHADTTLGPVGLAVQEVLAEVDPEPTPEDEAVALAAVQEASFGGMVKCPECGVLNVKSAKRCKNCGHDMSEVTAKAKADGRSNVSEAVLAAMR